MNKKYIKYFVVLILVILILLIGSFFLVRGSEISGVSDMTGTCTVTVTKYSHMDLENKTEYTLDAEQIQQLKTLILDSSFTRVLSSAVSFHDRDQYDILIDFNNQQDSVMIHCIGNEYVQISGQFGGNHLKINNSEWKATLEAIISASK